MSPEDGPGSVCHPLFSFLSQVRSGAPPSEGRHVHSQRRGRSTDRGGWGAMVHGRVCGGPVGVQAGRGAVGGGEGQGCIGTPSPPLLPGRPAYAQPLSPKRQVPASMAFETDSNRPPTALATSSNRLPNRLWGRLRGPFPSDASLGGGGGREEEEPEFRLTTRHQSRRGGGGGGGQGCIGRAVHRRRRGGYWPFSRGLDLIRHTWPRSASAREVQR